MSELATITGQYVTTLERRTDSWVGVVRDVGILAAQIADTDFVPEAFRGNAAAITAVILYGREVGLPPMQALRSTHMVNGRPALAAEAMRALALAHGHTIRYDVSTGTTCRVAGRRAGEDRWHVVEWTIDAAKLAGLASKQTWRSYPRAMLKARATAELCRDHFADAIGGYVAVEEYDVMPDAVSAAEPVAELSAPVSRKRARQAVSAAPVPVQRDDAVEDVIAVQPERAIEDHELPTERSVSATHIEHNNEDVRTVLTAEQDHGDWVDVPLPFGAASDPDETGEVASQEQAAKVFVLLRQFSVDGTREERLGIARALLQRDVQSFADLTRREASSLIDTLSLCAAAEDGADKLDALVQQGEALLRGDQE